MAKNKKDNFCDDCGEPYIDLATHNAFCKAHVCTHCEGYSPTIIPADEEGRRLCDRCLINEEERLVDEGVEDEENAGDFLS